MKRRNSPSTDSQEPSAKKACPGSTDGSAMEEDIEATLAEMNSLHDQFYSKTASLKDLMQNVLKTKASSSPKTDLSVEDIRRQGVVLLSALKQTNRKAQEQVKDQREAVQDGKRRVDSLQLALQNLHYQVLHLKREAAKCLDFQAVDETVSLVPQQDYLATLQEQGQDTSEYNDEHTLMLARLRDELEQRKELVSRRCTTTTERDFVIGEIKELREHLAGMRPGLDTLLKATAPMQTALQSSFAERRQTLETARHLPGPLYMLFAQLHTHNEMKQDGGDGGSAAPPSFSLVLSIGGDCEAGRKLTTATIIERRAKFLRRESDSDREAGEEDESQHAQHRKSKRRRTVTNEGQRHTMVLLPHPMTVNATVTEKGCGSVEMVFKYLPMLDVVVVQATATWQAPTVSSCSSFLTASGVLNNLVEEDDGTAIDSTVADEVMKQQHMEKFEQYVGESGLAYRWVQRLSGYQSLDPSVESPKQLDEVIKALRGRIDSRFALLQQLTALEQCEIPIRGNSSAFFPTRLSNKMVSFTAVREPLTLSWVCLSPKAQLVRKTDLCYVAQLERKTGDRAQLHAAVFISQEYPRVSPLFIVHLMNAATSPSSPSSLSQFTALRHIEKELNIHYGELINKDHDDVDILGLLIRRLQMCFDVLIETDGSKPGESVVTEKRFLLPRGGRDHSRAFRYNGVHQVFLPR